MKLLAVAAFIVCYVTSNGSAIKPTSSRNGDLIQKRMLTALDNNDAFTAKQLMQKCTCQMKQHCDSVEDSKTRQNLMKTVNLYSRRLEAVDPDDECSCDDMRTIFGAATLLLELVAAIGTASTFQNFGFILGGLKNAIKLGLYRYKHGDYSGIVTGILVGLTFGANSCGTNTFFRAFRIPLSQFHVENFNTKASDGYCDSYQNQMQFALDHCDTVKAKKLFQECSCQMKKQIPNAKDKQTEENMIETVDLFDKRIKEVEPDKDCSCEDMRKFYKGIGLGFKFAEGFGLGVVLASVNGAIQLVEEGFETAACRLKRNDLRGAATGFVAGGLHGASRGVGDGLFKGLRIPLEKC